MVTYLGNDILEVALPPCLGGVGHHGERCVVVLLVLVVQEHQLSPQVRLLSCSQYLPTHHISIKQARHRLQGLPKGQKIPIPKQMDYTVVRFGKKLEFEAFFTATR
jgi:hypothetical protein